MVGLAALLLGLAHVSLFPDSASAVAPETPAGACIDPSPDGGGEPLFAGIGAPNHSATRQGELCPSGSDVWVFSTFEVPAEQFIGIKVTEKVGTVAITVVLPGGEEVTLEPGEEYRAAHGFQPVTYEVRVTGGGTELASYRIHLCRAIFAPCEFDEDITPKPGDVSCSGAIDSVDAQLILQYGAGFIDALPCPQVAHTNLDGFIDAVDAALILQLEAGFIDQLPVAKLARAGPSAAWGSVAASLESR